MNGPISLNWTFCVDSGWKEARCSSWISSHFYLFFVCFWFVLFRCWFFFENSESFQDCPVLLLYRKGLVTKYLLKYLLNSYAFLRILPLPLYSLIHLFNVKVLMWPGSWQCKHPLQPSFPWRRWIGALKRCQCCEQLQRKSYCCCRESCKLSSQGLSVIKC